MQRRERGEETCKGNVSLCSADETNLTSLCLQIHIISLQLWYLFFFLVPFLFLSSQITAVYCTTGTCTDTEKQCLFATPHEYLFLRHNLCRFVCECVRLNTYGKAAQVFSAESLSFLLMCVSHHYTQSQVISPVLKVCSHISKVALLSSAPFSILRDLFTYSRAQLNAYVSQWRPLQVIEPGPFWSTCSRLF